MALSRDCCMLFESQVCVSSCRVKQLKPVKWTRIENMSDADERGVRRGNQVCVCFFFFRYQSCRKFGSFVLGCFGELQNRWMCHACRRTLTNSTRMMHLRNCGHVVCFTCAQTFITTDGACTCGVQAPSNDSVSIASGGLLTNLPCHFNRGF
jgi:hypothetical protein